MLVIANRHASRPGVVGGAGRGVLNPVKSCYIMIIRVQSILDHDI